MSAKRATERQWQALERLGGHFLDVVAGLPTLRAFGRAQSQARAGAADRRRAPRRPPCARCVSRSCRRWCWSWSRRCRWRWSRCRSGCGRSTAGWASRPRCWCCCSRRRRTCRCGRSARSSTPSTEGLAGRGRGASSVVDAEGGSPAAGRAPTPCSPTPGAACAVRRGHRAVPGAVRGGARRRLAHRRRGGAGRARRAQRRREVDAARRAARPRHADVRAGARRR